MRFHNGPTDGQTHTHAGVFRGEKAIEKAREMLRIDAWAAVLDAAAHRGRPASGARIGGSPFGRLWYRRSRARFGKSLHAVDEGASHGTATPTNPAGDDGLESRPAARDRKARTAAACCLSWQLHDGNRLHGNQRRAAHDVRGDLAAMSRIFACWRRRVPMPWKGCERAENGKHSLVAMPNSIGIC